MNFIDMNAPGHTGAAQIEGSRNVIANAHTLANAVVMDLLGKEIGRSKEIDVRDLVTSSLNNALLCKIEHNHVVLGDSND